MGLKSSLLDLVQSFQELNPFTLGFTFKVKEKSIDKGLQTTLYRIVQELLTNAVKYSRASIVSIKLLQQKHQIKLLYNDNGVGFDPTITRSGLGLKNLKNRAEAYMGTILLETSVGQGCHIAISFPKEDDNCEIT